MEKQKPSNMVVIGEHRFIKITWGSAASILGAVVGIVLWLASVDSRATDAINRLDRQDTSLVEMRRDVSEIKERTSRMEGLLNFIKDRVK